MRRFIVTASLGMLLASCTTAPPAPVAPTRPVAGKPMPYRWTQGNAPQAHKDAVAIFGPLRLAPGDFRWAPNVPTAGETRVVIDLLTQLFYVYRGEQLVGVATISSGKKGDETPMLTSVIHSVVINPPWNVPSRIAREELWPKEKAEPGYLARNNYRIIPVEGGQPRLQQASGDSSALGRFKFDFDNPFAVYLHDTPSKGGFDLYARQASHGCVRVEKPRALAEALLEGDATWTPEAIDKQLEGDKTVRARLTNQVPVFIFYWTAFAGGDGQMNFRSDPYNWDRELLQRVGVLAAGTKV